MSLLLFSNSNKLLWYLLDAGTRSRLQNVLSAREPTSSGLEDSDDLLAGRGPGPVLDESLVLHQFLPLLMCWRITQADEGSTKTLRISVGQANFLITERQHIIAVLLSREDCPSNREMQNHIFEVVYQTVSITLGPFLCCLDLVPRGQWSLFDNLMRFAFAKLTSNSGDENLILCPGYYDGSIALFDEDRRNGPVDRILSEIQMYMQPDACLLFQNLQLRRISISSSPGAFLSPTFVAHLCIHVNSHFKGSEFHDRARSYQPSRSEDAPSFTRSLLFKKKLVPVSSRSNKWAWVPCEVIVFHFPPSFVVTSVCPLQHNEFLEKVMLFHHQILDMPQCSRSDRKQLNAVADSIFVGLLQCGTTSPQPAILRSLRRRWEVFFHSQGMKQQQFKSTSSTSSAAESEIMQDRQQRFLSVFESLISKFILKTFDNTDEYRRQLCGRICDRIMGIYATSRFILNIHKATLKISPMLVPENMELDMIAYVFFSHTRRTILASWLHWRRRESETSTSSSNPTDDQQMSFRRILTRSYAAKASPNSPCFVFTAEDRVLVTLCLTRRYCNGYSQNESGFWRKLAYLVIPKECLDGLGIESQPSISPAPLERTCIVALYPATVSPRLAFCQTRNLACHLSGLLNGEQGSNTG